MTEVRRLRRVVWIEPPSLPETVDWADVRAVAVLARSLSSDDCPGRSPLRYILEALETFEHTARAAAEMAHAFREVAGGGPGRPARWT